MTWDSEYRFFSDNHWKKPERWNRKAKDAGIRYRVFCASMCDLFEKPPPSEFSEQILQARARAWKLIDDTPFLDWLLLTKRPENILHMAPKHWVKQWPKNVWPGTSTENQQEADQRIRHLLQVPSSIRFISAEPLLDMIKVPYLGKRDINWVITDAESGCQARPTDLDWVRSLRDQCVTAGVPFFFKQQSGDKLQKLDGKRWDQFPTGI
jgi:protein gp37